MSIIFMNDDRRERWPGRLARSSVDYVFFEAPSDRFARIHITPDRKQIYEEIEHRYNRHEDSTRYTT